MRDISLDDLVQALQSAFLTAQDSLKQRRLSSIQRTHAVDEAGEVRFPVLSFSVPNNSADEKKYEKFTVPVSTFFDNSYPLISSLSFEFECELVEKRHSDAGKIYVLTIKKDGEKRPKAKNRGLMSILFKGMDRPEGEIRINGKLFMEIPFDGPTAAVTPEKETLKPPLRSFLGRLRNLWRPQEYLMSGDQADSLRKILEQSFPETPGNPGVRGDE